VSEKTVEENILKKANQKRMLGDMAIEGGNFTTAFFKQVRLERIYCKDNTQGVNAEGFFLLLYSIAFRTLLLSPLGYLIQDSKKLLLVCENNMLLNYHLGAK